MRLSMIRTHPWPPLSEMSGWLKSGPVCEVSQWPINNPSPQYGSSYTSKNNNAATWISCLDTDCDPERHLYACAASRPATPDYHFTPSNRQRPGASLTLDSASSAPAEYIHLLFTVHFSDSQDNLDIIFTTCFPVLHMGDENINEMPEHWWLTGCWGEEKKLCTSAKGWEPLSDKREGIRLLCSETPSIVTDKRMH